MKRKELIETILQLVGNITAAYLETLAKESYKELTQRLACIALYQKEKLDV